MGPGSHPADTGAPSEPNAHAAPGARPTEPNAHAAPGARPTEPSAPTGPGAPATPVAGSIADAVVLKRGEAFFLCPPSGSIPPEGHHAFGLYYRDSRHLRGYELRIGGRRPTPAGPPVDRGDAVTLALASPALHAADGPLPAGTLLVAWDRRIDGALPALRDRITVTNRGPERVELPLSLRFRAQFEDIFEVRGFLAPRAGRARPPVWRSGVLVFTCAGADGAWRALGVHLRPSPAARTATGATLVLGLDPGDARSLDVVLVVAEADTASAAVGHVLRDPGRVSRGRRPRAAPSDPLDEVVIRSDSRPLDDALQASLRDLRMLRSEMSGRAYFSAGLPWYAALFGRDSLVSAMQTLAFAPGIAADTLRLLAEQQGRQVDPRSGEEPGRIVHELRIGESARLGLVPFARDFGTVDATPLFLVLLGRYTAWTGDLALFLDLREAADAALRWLDSYGDRSGHGWLEYEGRATEGLANEGWKDSDEAIVREDGSLAQPPIALVEAQAYAWLARVAMADLFEWTGDRARANRLRRAAAGLRRRFERAFWQPDLGCYALALEGGTRPCRVVASNAGHALWAGIAGAGHAATTIRRLMAPDMFSGWGIRTLSALERRYDPLGYHVGSVWPHDNAMIAAGFRRYGQDQPALRVFEALVGAADHVPLHRLPELYGGQARGAGGPVPYPVACQPQAWAAGSIPYLLLTLLGLQGEGFEQRLRVIRPVLPPSVRLVEVGGLAVGGGRVDLRFERRAASSRADVIVTGRRGDVEVLVEAGPDWPDDQTSDG